MKLVIISMLKSHSKIQVIQNIYKLQMFISLKILAFINMIKALNGGNLDKLKGQLMLMYYYFNQVTMLCSNLI